MREIVKRQRKRKKAEDEGNFLRKNAEWQRKYVERQKKNTDAEERLRRFKQAIRFGPIFVCRCCERKLFEKQVVEVGMDAFKTTVNELEPGLFDKCINTFSNIKFSTLFCESADQVASSDIGKRNFLCKSCKLSMERGKMPKMCSNNGLKVDVLPKPDLRLSELENNLIALNIVFQKLHFLPKSRWSGTHDRLVNIPIGEQDVVNLTI